MRKPESFGRRLDGYGDALRVAGPIGSPLGLCTIRDDELDQIFVAPGARGTPLASALLRDGEQRMAVSGVGLAHLLCVQQNTRAAAFYRREGWQFRETSRQPVQTEAGPFLFDLLVFEKHLLPINSEFNKIQC